MQIYAVNNISREQVLQLVSIQLPCAAADDLNVDAAEWRQLFAATGGVAAVGPRLGNGQPNFTITGGEQVRNQLACFRTELGTAVGSVSACCFLSLGHTAMICSFYWPPDIWPCTRLA